ncbi:MAG: VCBS repeat-containing protein [Myxococcota bacterium]
MPRSIPTLIVLTACLLVGPVGCAWLVVSEAETPLAEPDPLAFAPLEVDFAHRWNPDTSHHLTGAAVLDVDGDGRDELFVGGGQGQADALLTLRDGRLVPLPDALGLSSDAATYGALALDWDEDGDVDLFVCRQDGLTLYRREGERFRGEKIPLDLAPQAVPVGVTVGDLEGDGDPDLYVSVFIAGPQLRSATFNDPDHAKPNVLLRNDGAAGFTDITTPVTASLQNTFTASFVDLDGDRLPELVVAQNTGEVEILANRGDGRFERIPVDTGFGFWMGLAIGDVDADGDVDLFFSNLGNSIPNLFTRGDLQDGQRHAPEWLLLRNDGGLRFTDITAASGLTGYGFAWGALFEDLDLDGRLDLLVAENYVRWPLHGLRKLPGKGLVQRGEGTRFFASEAIDNRAFGQTPLFADFDGDARLDLFWLNNDAPSRAFRNRSDRPFLYLDLPDTASAVGAQVRLLGTQGAVHQVANGQGLASDSSAAKVYGFAPGARPTAVEVTWANGTTWRLDRPLLGVKIAVPPPWREGSVP